VAVTDAVFQSGIISFYIILILGLLRENINVYGVGKRFLLYDNYMLCGLW
jgi:hypothetical protein